MTTAPRKPSRTALAGLALLAGSFLHAAPLPDEAALTKLIETNSRIAFLAGFGGHLDVTDPGQFPALREMLTKRLNQETRAKPRVAESLAILDATWAAQAPRALLDAASARKQAPSLDAQAAALHTLLKQDMEAAIAYYFKLPLYESFSHHCHFYDQLSAIDPARAARLYLESPDKGRAYLNPLETAFATWANRDPDAAWTAASRIDDEKKRRTARTYAAKAIAKSTPAKFEELLATLPDERQRKSLRDDVMPTAKPTEERPAPPAAGKNVIARENAELEQMLKAGYDAYDSKKSDDASRKVELMFTRFPERSWQWLQDMSLNDSYATNRYRDLAGKWPAEKLAADTARMLDSTNAKERLFAIQLGHQWMKADPEAAIPFLFSRHPRLGKTWREALPFHTMIYLKKWDNGRILALMDQIEAPVWRDLARRSVILDFILNKPPAEGLSSLLALQHPEDIDRALGSFVRSGIRGEQRRGFIDLVLGIGPEHARLRDRMLELLPYEILDTNDADVGAIPKIIAAISDPDARLRALEKIPEYQTPAILSERMLEILVDLPAGTLRDRRIDATLSRIPAADLLALLKRTGAPFLRSKLLARVPAADLDERDFTSCLEMLNTLPAVWKNEVLEDKWLLAQATRDPARWGETLKQYATRRGASSLLHQTMDQWIKRDPAATLEAISSTGPMPETAGWILPCLRILNRDDFAATFRDFRSRPAAADRVIPDLFSQWSQSEPAAACAASLLVVSADLRLKVFSSCILKWITAVPDAAAQWIKDLPDGPERRVAVEQLAAHLHGKKAKLPGWLETEFPRKRPGSSESSKEEQEKSRKLAEARQARERTVAGIRSLALLDEKGVIANVRKLPDGAHKTDSLLGLLGHAVASGNDALRREITRQLSAASGVTPADIAGAVMRNLPPARLEQAAQPMLREVITASARAELAHALLDHRKPPPQVIGEAELDDETLRSIQRRIDQQHAEKPRKPSPPEP